MLLREVWDTHDFFLYYYNDFDVMDLEIYLMGYWTFLCYLIFFLSNFDCCLVWTQEKSVLDCELGKRADFLEDNGNFAFIGAPENVGFLQMIGKMLPLVGYSVAECVEFLEVVRF